ncbi:ligand-dependent nuclear receptor-interacting factor 1 isoform X2 [Esox lucius]|uniref:ligand-dependent nuclear receptor-interacting factor 1 isoform X2 n=1 Tax=Esox lucius TaxID=8010 RepID=UPI001476B719|nr:ligand-dependent nuclear receptor-interacting factor 1 isoform X2 [Esox lucius]
MSNLKQVSYNNQGKTTASQGAGLSGTGVFYQAMPAVGTDGRNVMKLIPVQKVNGQFVRLPTNTIKGTEHQGDLTLNLSSMSKGNTPTSGSTARGQFRNKSPTPQILSTSPKPPSLTTGIYPSVRIHTPIVTSKLTQQTGPLTSPELTCKKTLGVTLKKQLPVTVKSPVLPNGQYLQIPPNAQVKTLPASALPPAIKRQIFTSSMTCVSKSPMVLYVSPVQTMKQGGTPLCSTSQKAVLSLSRIQGSSGQTVSTCSTQCSTTSKDSRPPVTPIKWVIEEADGSPAPCLVPVKSTSVTSEILKTLAKMENAQKTGENPPKMSLSTQESETKIGQAKDNALVMYNGKVYFVAKKTPELCNRPSEPLEGSRNVGDSSTHTTESLGFNQKILPPSIPPTSSFGSQLSSATRRDPNHIVIPDDIIDLCDDDPQDDLTCQAVSTKDITEQSFTRSEVDEDEDSNVIFVSYLPPKKVSKVGEDKVVTHMLDDLETEQEVFQCNLNNLVEDSQNKVSVVSAERCRSVGKAQEIAGCQRTAAVQELISHQQNIIATGLKNIKGDATSLERGSSQPSGSNQEMVNVQSDATDQGIRNNSAATQENIPGNTSLQLEMEALKEKSSSDFIHEQRRSMLNQDSLKTCDRLLKQMFGIKSDVKICLERVDAKPLAIPKVFPWIGTTNKRTIEAIRKLLQGSKIVVKKREHKETELHATKNNDSFVKDAKIQKIEKVEKASENLGKSLNCPQLDMQLHSSPTPQLDMQILISPTPQLDLQVLTNPTPQQDMDVLTNPTPQQDMDVLTNPAPQQDMDVLTNPAPQQDMDVLINPTTQQDMDVLINPTPQQDMDVLTNPTPQQDMDVLTNPAPQLERQHLTSMSPQLDMLSDAEQIFGYEEPTVSELISNTIKEVSSKPLTDHHPVHISKRSSNTPVPSIHTETNIEAMDSLPGLCCSTANNIKTNSRRRGKGRRCTACPCGVIGTLVPEKAMCSLSTSHEDPGSFKPVKQKGRKSIKFQIEDKESPSVEVQFPSTVTKHGSSTAGEIPMNYFCSAAPMDPEEIKRYEKIKRLKELLKEKEAALAMIRKNMG